MADKLGDLILRDFYQKREANLYIFLLGIDGHRKLTPYHLLGFQLYGRRKTSGESRFQLRKWFPKDLYCFFISYLLFEGEKSVFLFSDQKHKLIRSMIFNDRSVIQKMKIAIIGIRGIPANYGGFETFSEELAPRLVKRGHRVTVYGRSNIINNYKTGDYYQGVKLIILTTVSYKYLDTVVHTFLCVIHSLFHPYDVILLCNAANSIFALIPRLVGQTVVVNVDGIERKRKKWNWLGKLWYLLGELFSIFFPNELVSDAKVIQDYYWNRYHKRSTFIPYGANTEKVKTIKALDKFSITPNEYILYVSRLEPENNAHTVIKAFKKVKSDFKLVIVGDAPYATEYKSYLKDLAERNPRIIFTGFVFGKGYKEFQSNAYCYIHATEVGGTHPALIEAMGFGNCVIANRTPENIEAVGDAGIIYKKNDVEDLREKIEYIIKNPEVIRAYGEKAKERVKANYSWDAVTDKYENLFLEMVN